MKRGLKLGAIAIGALVAVPLATLWIAGSFLDREHHASASRRIEMTPAAAFARVTDVDAYLDWRDLDSVEVLSREPLRWREVGPDGAMTFVEVERVADRRLVIRMDDPDAPFGGTWTIAIAPDGDGASVRITEDGWIDPPPFRALARWGWGYDASARAYLDRLAARGRGGAPWPATRRPR